MEAFLMRTRALPLLLAGALSVAAQQATDAAAPPPKPALRDTDSEVRQRATEALGNITETLANRNAAIQAWRVEMDYVHASRPLGGLGTTRRYQGGLPISTAMHFCAR